MRARSSPSTRIRNARSSRSRTSAWSATCSSCCRSWKRRFEGRSVIFEGMKPRLLLVSRKWPPAVGGMETYSVELDETLLERFDVQRLVLPGGADGRPPGLPGYAAFLIRAMLFCL